MPYTNKKFQNLVDTLKSLGLSQNEASVYLAALDCGPSSIINISDTADIKRTTTYAVVERLQDMGLFRIDLIDGEKKYIAEHPSKLDLMVKQKRKLLDDSLPDLLDLYGKESDESFIKYYKGIDAVKNVYNDLLYEARSGEDYLVMSDLDQWLELDRDFFGRFWHRRAKRGVSARLILQYSKKSQRAKKTEKKYRHKIKLLPSKSKISTNLVITPRKVVTHQMAKPIFAMVVENKSIIKMNKEMFEVMWKSL